MLDLKVKFYQRFVCIGKNSVFVKGLATIWEQASTENHGIYSQRILEDYSLFWQDLFIERYVLSERQNEKESCRNRKRRLSIC